MTFAVLQPIVPGLYLLPSENGGRFPQSHAFVVRDDIEALIDAGCGLDRLRELQQHWQPDLAIASHAHPDHCAGLWLFAGTRLLSPQQHADKFWRFEPMSLRLTEPGTLAQTWKAWIKQNMGIRETQADAHFADGTLFDFGKVKLRAVHAPGHLDDHYIFFEEHHGLALLFDIDLTGFGPWYGHRESDIDLFIAAIEKVIALQPKMAVSSHKGVITDEIEKRLRDFAAVFNKRDELLLSLLREEKTLQQLVDVSPIYRGHPYMPPVMRYWEELMIEKHLVRLERHGSVVNTEGRWQRI